MAVQNTYDLVNYYAKLLIYQYLSKQKSYNTIITSITPIVMTQESVQFISFSDTPTSGTFQVSYLGNLSSAINWNDSANTVQTKIQNISGLSMATVSGDINVSIGLSITFVGFINVPELLIIKNNSLLVSLDSVNVFVTETDLTLPLAVQDAFNIETAVGVQLNLLGKYSGVTRTVSTPSKTINLNDDDFRTLIKFAVVQNNSGSSLETIEENLNQFFSGKFLVTDYKNMYMSYIFQSDIGSPEFFEALIKEKLIPKPMGVGFSVIIPPDINQFFGYSTYQQKGMNPHVKPYNTYEDFNTDWFYLDYNDFIL